MMSDLPEFSRPKRENVEVFIRRALISERTTGNSALRELIAYDDGHFRAVFSPSYFALADGAALPTKSQWSTLKKHLKRIEPRLFIFKEHGTLERDGETLLYVDFGYFAYDKF
jgi:hypothetical protein